MSEQIYVYQKMQDGREVPTNVCNCGHCENEFYVPALSDEWMPSFCPFCGIKFLRREHDGVPADYEPVQAIETFMDAAEFVLSYAYPDLPIETIRERAQTWRLSQWHIEFVVAAQHVPLSEGCMKNLILAQRIINKELE